jgi:tRNA-2-methylthio-N6-dimethylallyladenosine synthase
MPNQVDEKIVGERYTRLHERLQKTSLEINQRAVGTTHRVMVNEIEGRRDGDRGRITGRSEDFRLVHFEPIEGARPGDFVDVEITEASAHYLIGTPLKVISTRGGDAHEARTREVSGPAPTMLGIPTLKK